MKITALAGGRVRTPAWIGADSALSFADPGLTRGYVRGGNILIENWARRFDISWYNQFSSKRTKGVIFNSTGEERWGGKAISKYTITSQTETSNPNITRHAPHQRFKTIWTLWKLENKCWFVRKDGVDFLQNSQPCNNLVSNTLWWPRVADPLSCPVINTFSATQTLTWTQFVQTYPTTSELPLNIICTQMKFFQITRNLNCPVMILGTF